MKKSIGMNAFINGFRTIISLLFPLITYPYITGILGADMLGKYSFSHSVANYFYLIAGLGISTYAVREGAKYRNDKKKMGEFASEIFSINIISTLVSYILLIISLLCFHKLHSYSILIMILSVQMLFTTIGCEWMFSIYEEYFYIAVRTIAFQILSLICMFVFIKDKNDINWYSAIIVLSSSGANLVNIVSIKKRYKFGFSFSANMKQHLKPILILFANSVATTVYVNSDLTILGIMSTDYNVGIYTLSSKIYSIAKQVLSAIIIVSIPRLAFLWGQNEKEKFSQLALKILSLLMCFVLPATIGVAFLQENIILMLSTSEFLAASSSLLILCIALIFCLFNWFFTSCVLIPSKQEKTVLTATIISAIVNVLLNLVLIPFYHENAAAFTTVIAEAVSLVIVFTKSRKCIRIHFSVRDMVSVVLGCVLIGGVCMFTNNFTGRPIMNILISVLCSSIVYICFLFITKHSVTIIAKKFIHDKLSKI